MSGYDEVARRTLPQRLRLGVLITSSLLLIATASTSEASCSRIGNYVTCTDGSNYRTQGNSTYGYNAQTGSTWSQRQIGNSTYGNDSQGNSWSARRIGNSTYYTDSQGNSTACRQVGNKVYCN